MRKEHEASRSDIGSNCSLQHASRSLLSFLPWFPSQITLYQSKITTFQSKFDVFSVVYTVKNDDYHACQEHPNFDNFELARMTPKFFFSFFFDQTMIVDFVFFFPHHQVLDIHLLKPSRQSTTCTNVPNYSLQLFVVQEHILFPKRKDINNTLRALNCYSQQYKRSSQPGKIYDVMSKLLCRGLIRFFISLDEILIT